LLHLGVLGEAEVLGEDQQAIGNHLYGAFERDFGCADCQRLMVAAISIGQWKALVEACAAAPAIRRRR
jgi:2-methylfumaryl-CoA isomerase